MAVTPTEFRNNLFQLLDQAIESGKVIEIYRNGKIIKVVPPKKENKLDKLKAHPDAIVGNSDDLVEIDWSSERKASI